MKNRDAIFYDALEKSTPPCPLCGAEAFEVLARDDRYGMGVSTAGCLGCGLVQTWPRPTEQAMARFYRDAYRIYYQGTGTPGATYTRRFRKAERLAYTADSILETAGLCEGARILDVGCAEGTLFKQLQRAGKYFRFVGIEPNASFAAYAMETTGCATYADLDALLAGGEPKFDLAIVNHVLEHIGEPVWFLRQVRSLLSAEGKIFVDVPDAVAYVGPESLHIAHIFHFSARTLVRTLEQSGFEILGLDRHCPPHHPPSIRVVAGAVVAARALVATSPETEVEAWQQVRAIGEAVPGYLRLRRLRRPAWLVAARNGYRRWRARY